MPDQVGDLYALPFDGPGKATMTNANESRLCLLLADGPFDCSRWRTISAIQIAA
jgi:hypothetical protein